MYSASDVKDLRERTGAGMMDCKKAWDASEGNMDKAIDWLRENGIAKEKGIEGYTTMKKAELVEALSK